MPAVTNPIAALEAVVPNADAQMLDLTEGRFPQTFVGMILGDADLAGRPKDSFVMPIEPGEDTQWKLRFNLDQPETSGTNVRNLTWPNTEVIPSQYQKPIEGRFDVSAYDGSHWIDEPTFDRLTKSEAAFNIELSNIEKTIVNSKNRALQEHMLAFAAGNVTPSWATWGADDDRVMHVGYPLQSGYADNSATPDSTVYQYGLNLDMNQFGGGTDLRRLKAVSAGSVATPFGVMDPTNLRTQIINPLKRKDKQASGSRLYALCDTEVWNYIQGYVEDFVRISNAGEMSKFGYTECGEYCGIRFIYEPYLDDLAAVGGAERVVYFIDPATWMIRHYKFDQTTSVSGEEAKKAFRRYVKWVWLWDFRFQILCKMPWRNAMAYNVELS